MRSSLFAVTLAGAVVVGGSSGAEETRCTGPKDGARFEMTERGGSHVQLEWRSAGAEAKRLQISTDAGFEKPLLFDRAVFSSRTQLRGMEAGTYHWRVLDGGAELCRASFDVVPHPKAE